MSIAIMIGILVPVGIGSLSSSSKHHRVPFGTMLVIVLLFAPLFSIVFAFLISQWFRLASVTISDETIQGRTSWGTKNKIPLNDITKLTRLHSNGIRAIVVHSKYHGKIYISDKTERLSELMSLLAPHVGHNVPKETT